MIPQEEIKGELAIVGYNQARVLALNFDTIQSLEPNEAITDDILHWDNGDEYWLCVWRDPNAPVDHPYLGSAFFYVSELAPDLCLHTEYFATINEARNTIEWATTNHHLARMPRPEAA